MGTMGTDDVWSDEKPEHLVYLDWYWMHQTESHKQFVYGFHKGYRLSNKSRAGWRVYALESGDQEF